MIDKILQGSSKGIEMKIVCSDLSLLENINGLLCKSGILGIRDRQGNLHYIVDGRTDRQKATEAAQSLIFNRNTNREESDVYYDICAKRVFKRFGMELSKIGAVVLYEEIRRIIYSGIEIPINMKTIYMEATTRYSMTYAQIERDVRYAIKSSRLSDLGSRQATRILINSIKKSIVDEGKDDMQKEQPVS